MIWCLQADQWKDMYAFTRHLADDQGLCRVLLAQHFTKPNRTAARDA